MKSDPDLSYAAYLLLVLVSALAVATVIVGC